MNKVSSFFPLRAFLVVFLLALTGCFTAGEQQKLLEDGFTIEIIPIDGTQEGDSIEEPKPTATPLPTPTPLPSPLPTPTATPVPTPTPSPSPTATPAPTPTPLPSPTPTPVPTPTPTPGEDCSLQSQVIYNGITITFDQAYPVGYFVDDMPFVVGPISIVSINPPSLSTLPGGRRMNGAMLNPDGSNSEQGFDNTMYRDLIPPRYYDDLNVALDLSPSSPLAISPGNVLLATRSRDAAGALPQVDAALPLTVTDTCHQPGYFRPSSWQGAPKGPTHHVSDVDFAKLLNLQASPQMPSIEEVIAQVQGHHSDPAQNWTGRYWHPATQMPNYGREIARSGGLAALVANTQGVSMLDKHFLATRLVQQGLDNYWGIVAGGGYPGNGGHNSGRLVKVCMAGHLLNDQAIKNVCGTGVFGETDQTFFVSNSDLQYGYNSNELGTPEWRMRADPGTAVASWWGNNYRTCCTAHVWWSAATVLEEMGLRSMANHEPFFEYMIRYHNVMTDPVTMASSEWAPWKLHSSDSWSFNMYVQHVLENLE